eukprot:16286607-Heterocapsa_arctica.AAC.1
MTCLHPGLCMGKSFREEALSAYSACLYEYVYGSPGVPEQAKAKAKSRARPKSVEKYLENIMEK